MGGPGSGGHNAQPNVVKLLHGTRKDRINRHEPVPAADDVVPPVALTPEGLEVWNRLAPDRIRTGVLTPWDVDAFALFCEAVVLAHDAVSYASGHIEDRIVPGAQSPVSRLREAVAVCATLGSRFGWTPSDRARLVIGKEGRDPKEDLLTG